MIRRLPIFLLVIAIAALTMGMESMGGSDKFPTPKVNYLATVTDTTMVVHQASFVSIGGDTDLSGYRGKAFVTIHFKRISRVAVKPGESKAFVRATVTLTDGEQVDLKVKGLLRCYGVTDIGNMSIRMRDVRSIELKKGPDEPEK
jgi:hypothetical protein